MLCLGAQHDPPAARFVILDGRPPDAGQTGPLHEVAAVLPHETQFIGWREVAGAIADLAAETQRRLQTDQADAPAVYVLIYGLQRYRLLRRQEESFSFSTLYGISAKIRTVCVEKMVCTSSLWPRYSFARTS